MLKPNIFTRLSAFRLGRVVIICIAFFHLTTIGAPRTGIDNEGLKSTNGVTKIALFEPYFKVERILAGGVPEVRADWTESSISNFRQTLGEVLTEKNLQLVSYRTPNDEAHQRHRQLEKLNQAVGMTIIQNSVLKLPTKEGKFDWTIGEGAKLLKQTSGADYGLYVHYRRGYTTGGRVALSLIAAVAVGAVVPTHYQFGFASLVDLDTGQVVWFNDIRGSGGDLRHKEKSLATVKTLLSGFPQLGFVVPEDEKTGEETLPEYLRDCHSC